MAMESVERTTTERSISISLTHHDYTLLTIGTLIGTALWGGIGVGLGMIVRNQVHEAFMQGPAHAIELFHGNTYSGHPLACAAGIASLDLYRDEDLFARAREIALCESIITVSTRRSASAAASPVVDVTIWPR